MDSTWGWVALITGTIAYWVFAVALWLAWQRLSIERKDPAIVSRISDNEAVIELAGEINLLRVGAVLLGPPLAGLVLLLVP